VNTGGTLNLLDAAVKHGITRFVYASSSSAYGDVTKFPQSEDDTLKPLSPYGVSKLCAENYCLSYNEVHGLPTVSLRYFNVYGPRQNPESLYSAVVPAFIDKVRKGQRPVIDGTGKQSRDFTYVKDVARANVRGAFAGKEAAGKAYNIASGHDYSVNEILNLICKYLKTKPNPIHGPKRRGDAMRTYASISLAKRYLGWTPQVNLQQGLKNTVQWFEKNNPQVY
jgi:nucleoside-diphosphate-sugar epimerase